ncbi:MAG: hypothetical protein JST53_01660 [Actinobacteria bacterium]|nr:hypothetical protein [Actinomycetota bacterium]
MGAHAIEFWEIKGENDSQFTAFCLSCSWVSGDGTIPEVEAEARAHERGERRPWQVEPGSTRPWRPGDPTTRAA